MKKVKILIFLVSFGGLSVKAQSTVSLVGEINYNTFSHKSLSDFQTQLSNDLNEVNLVINDDFGANIGFTFGLKFDKINTQFFVAYNSTGGKISYSDFSGVIRITQLLKGYTFGGEYHINLSPDTTKDAFYFGLRGLVTYNELKLENYSKIGNTLSTDALDFNSFDIGLGLRFIYDIPISVVKLRLNLGYDLLFGGQFKFKDNTDLLLENDQGDSIQTEWNGFRTGIGIVVPL